MRNFTLQIPTKFVFGSGVLDRCGKEIGVFHKKVLVVCSSGSAIRTGILGRLLKSLESAGVMADVYDKVMPNPRVSMVDIGGRIARDLKSEAVIGLGGGSAMDAAKGVAIVAKKGGSVWDYVHLNGVANESLPVITIPTLSATGSEGNGYGVVTKDDTLQKVGFVSNAVKPVLSIIDPDLTRSVPEDYFKDGAVDIITHAIEAYISSKDWAPLNDRISLSIIKTVVEMTDAILKDPKNMELRGVFAWSAMMALNGINDAGREGPYTVHSLEHPLSGRYDISHGRGLAMLLPRYLRYFAGLKREKIAEFGRFIFNTDSNDAIQAIEAFEQWLQSLGRALTLGDLNIPSEGIAQLVTDVFEVNSNRQGKLAGPENMSREDVTRLFTNCI